MTPYRRWLNRHGMVPLQAVWEPTENHFVFVSWDAAVRHPSGALGLIEAAASPGVALAWTQVARLSDNRISGLLFAFDTGEQAQAFRRSVARELASNQQPDARTVWKWFRAERK